MLDINKVQQHLQTLNLDGWLFYDFRGSNDIALGILGFSSNAHLTRRLFYFIPATGEPVKVANAIEAHNLKHLSGKQFLYSSYESLKAALASFLKPGAKIAIEYSPQNAIPYLSKVDAGTFEYLSEFGCNFVSSADLITLFDALWTEEQFADNKIAANALYDIVASAYNVVKERISKVGVTTEYEIQQYILSEFEQRDLFTDHAPIVAVNANSANPHFSPTEEDSSPIREGDFLLIDLWAKTKNERSVWADITWVGYCGTEVPEKYTRIFNIVRDARDAALKMVTERFTAGLDVAGYELDAAARKVISDAGYADYFIHRTGHSITTSLHGSGPHLDNFETMDTRRIFPGTSFSIEPGIYLTGDFGVRSEIDVFITPEGKVTVTGGTPQTSVLPILK